MRWWALLLLSGCSARPLTLPESTTHENPDAGPAFVDASTPFDLSSPDLALPSLAFATAEPLDGLGPGSPLLAADLDGDGADDLVAIQGQTANHAVCWGGVGAAALASCPFTTPAGLVAARTPDGLKQRDYLLSTGGVLLHYPHSTARSFAAPVQLAIPGVAPVDLTSADLDGDGLGEAIVSVAGTNLGFEIYPGIPSGLGASTHLDTGMRAPGPIRVGDFDGDGLTDVLDVQLQLGVATTLTVYRGDGMRGLDAATPTKVAWAYRFAIGDLDGDGIDDVVLAHGQVLAPFDPDFGNLTVLRGRGDGGFDLAGEVATGANPYFIALADFNRDGHLDVAIGDPMSSLAVRVLAGYGDGTFAAPLAFDAGTDHLWVMIAGDFDGDGAVDLVYGHGDGMSGAYQTPILLRNLAH